MLSDIKEEAEEEEEVSSSDTDNDEELKEFKTLEQNCLAHKRGEQEKEKEKEPKREDDNVADVSETLTVKVRLTS